MKSKKKIIIAALILALLAVLASVGIFTWNWYQNRHVFTVYQEGNYISQTVIDRFTEETGVKVKLVTGDRTPQAFETTLFGDSSTQTAEERVQEALMQGDRSTDPADDLPAEEQDPFAGMSLAEILQSTHDASVQRAEEKAAKKGKELVYEEISFDPAEYDVVLTDGVMLGELVERGLLLDLNTVEMENRGNVSGEYSAMPYDPDGAYTITTMWEYLGLLVNVELAQVHLTKWDALWDESFVGQVVMPSLAQDSAAVALLTMGMPVDEMDEDSINAAFDKLAEQKELVSEYHNRNAFLRMENGLSALYPCYSGEALEMMGENPSLIFMVPQGGTFRTTLGYGIAAESKFPEEAVQFVNYMCSGENMAKNAVYSRYASTSEAAIAEMDANWSSNPVLYPDKSITDGTPVLTTLPADLRELCAQRWETLMGSEEMAKSEKAGALN